MIESTQKLIAFYESIGMRRWADELKALFPSTPLEETEKFAVYRGIIL